MNNKGQTILVIAVVATVVAIAYFALSKPSSEAANLVSENTNEMTDIEREILNKLDTVKKIKIDTTVFQNPAFGELVDYSRAIVQEPVGRANPFAPINMDVNELYGDEAVNLNNALNERLNTQNIGTQNNAEIFNELRRQMQRGRRNFQQ